MRILHTESAMEMGGEELRVLAEVEGFKARGHSVSLAVPPGSLLQDIAKSKKIDTIPVPMNKGGSLFAVNHLARSCYDLEIAIINTHGSWDSWVGALAAKVSGAKPLVVRTRHKSIPVANHLANRLLYQGLTDHIITTGESVREQLIRVNGFDGRRITSIPTGVDLTRFRPGADGGKIKKEFRIVPGQLLVGTVSFLRKYKGMEYFIDAARMVLDKSPQAGFLMVGDGPEGPALREKMERLGLTGRMIMPGHREDIPDLLAALDIFVLASVEAEGVPQVITQALAMEKPVIATSVGAIGEVIKPGVSGLLVPPRDSGALAQGILSFMENLQYAKTLASQGRQLVETKYSLSRMLDRIESLYGKLLQDRKAS